MSESTVTKTAAAPEATPPAGILSELLAGLPPEVAETLGHKPLAPTTKPKKEENQSSEGENTEEGEITEEQENSEGEQSEEHENSEEENSEENQSEEQEGDEEGKMPEKFQKRIDKITRKRREAETERDQFKTENETLKAELQKHAAVTITPTPEDPLSHVESSEDLEASVSRAKQIRAWAKANRDGATITDPATGKERFVDAAEMERYLDSSEALLTEHAPARREYLRQREALLPEAKTTYPNLFKAGTDEHRILVDTLKQVPALKRLPGYEMVIGDAILGMVTRLNAAKKPDGKAAASTPNAATAGNRRPIAPAIPRASSTQPKSQPGNPRSAAKSALLEKGDASARESYFSTF